MKYATENFDVQKALGITVEGVTDAPFAAADAANAQRIERFEKDGCSAILVDGKLVVLNIEDQSADVSDEATNNEWIEFFKV